MINVPKNFNSPLASQYELKKARLLGKIAAAGNYPCEPTFDEKMMMMLNGEKVFSRKATDLIKAWVRAYDRECRR